MAGLGKKLAFIRTPGGGAPLYAQPRYIIPGVSPSHVAYGLAQYDPDEGFHSRAHAGVETLHGRRPLNNPSTTRTAVIGSQFSSLAALPIFQSFANLHWSDGLLAGVIARPDHPPLHRDWNPGQQGAKEQQKAIPYDPWPSSGALYPKAI